jgi:hypothetical protein
MLSVVMQSVVMLSVAAPLKVPIRIDSYLKPLDLCGQLLVSFRTVNRSVQISEPLLSPTL